MSGVLAFQFYNWHFFFAELVNGITVGSVYALIALGYTMVYGVLKLINFAHGDVFMIGAMVGYYVARFSGESRNPSIVGALLVALASMAACACLGFVTPERLSVSPDCGLSQTARWIARAKLAALVEGARRVRDSFSRPDRSEPPYSAGRRHEERA